MHRALTLVALSVAHAEVFVSSFRQQLGNANAALVQCAFPYAIRHGCILRLADNIEEDELNVARAYGKYNGHSPSDQVVPLVERFFDFTRGQPEPPACNRTGSARDWYLKRHEQGSGACGLQPPPSVHEAAEATRAVHRVFGINSTHAFGRDCRAAPPYLAAHVRSGDVFHGAASSFLAARSPPRPASYVHRIPSPFDTRQFAWAFKQPLNFDTSSVTEMYRMFGELSTNKVCTVNDEKMFVQGNCQSPDDTVELFQGVDTLNQSLRVSQVETYLRDPPKNQSVQVVVLVSGEVPFKVEGPLEVLLQVPAGRNLAIVGKSSEKDEARVEINVIEEFQVNGTLRLKGLEVSRASLGDQHDNKVGVPLVESK